MKGELLTIVEAEERADALLAQAKKHREALLAAAHARREKRLASIVPMSPKNVRITPVKPKTASLRTAAKAREKAAITHILEAFHAQA